MHNMLHRYVLFQFHFIGDTALASSLAPSRAKCTAFVARSSPPCFTFEMKLELAVGGLTFFVCPPRVDTGL